MSDAARISELEAEVGALREEVALLRQSRVVTLYPSPPAFGAAPFPQTVVMNAAGAQPYAYYGQAFANTGCAAPAPQLQTFGVHA